MSAVYGTRSNAGELPSPPRQFCLVWTNATAAVPTVSAVSGRCYHRIGGSVQPASHQEQPAAANETQTAALAETTWDFRIGGFAESKNDERGEIQFLSAGKVRYKNTSRTQGKVINGSWKQSNIIRIELSDGTKIEAEIRVGIMSAWISGPKYSSDLVFEAKRRDIPPSAPDATSAYQLLREQGYVFDPDSLAQSRSGRSK
jgi:hypothetical protein